MQKPGRTSVPNGLVGGGTVYSDAQVLALLAAGGLESWAFDRLDSGGRPLSDLTPFVAEGTVPTITHDSTMAVKRSLSVRIIGNAPLVPLSDQIGVRYLLGAPDGGWLEFRLGRFLVNQPRRHVSTGVTWLDIDGTDYSQLLVDTPFIAGTGLAAGTGYVAGALALARAYGGSLALQAAIADPGKLLPGAISWSADFSRLAAINQLLSAVNFGTLWFDENGVMRSDPIPDFNQVRSAVKFDTTIGAAQVSQWDETPDMSRAANIFVVVGQSPQGTAPVIGQYTNASPLSRVSTVRWHPKIRRITDSAIPDNATAAARAKIEAQAASRVYSELQVPTLAWPLGQDRDILGLTYSTADEGTVDGVFLELGWIHRCAPGQLTTHRLTRIEATT